MLVVEYLSLTSSEIRIKTIPVQVEDRFLTGEDARKIWEEIRHGASDRLVVALDGAPGVGKSTLAEMLQEIIRQSRVEVGLIETDLDCLPWAERPSNSGLMDWHDDTLVKEALAYPNARFSYTGYDPVSHDRTKSVDVFSPDRGVIIVEGLHSIEFACQLSDRPIVAIPFQISNELREIRRMERNINQGRWKAEEADERTESQRGPAIDYYSDLAGALDATSVNIHNSIRIFE